MFCRVAYQKTFVRADALAAGERSLDRISGVNEGTKKQSPWETIEQLEVRTTWVPMGLQSQLLVCCEVGWLIRVMSRLLDGQSKILTQIHIPATTQKPTPSSA